MKNRIISFQNNANLPQADGGRLVAYLVLDGRVRIDRKNYKRLGFLTILEPGDIVFPEAISGEPTVENLATAIGEVRCVSINLQEFANIQEPLRPGYGDWGYTHMRRVAANRRKEKSILELAYSMVAHLYFCVLYTSENVDDRRLSAKLNPIIKEIELYSLEPRLVNTCLDTLSRSGLMDIREDESFIGIVELPDPILFSGFVHHLSHKYRREAGVFKNDHYSSQTDYSPAAYDIIDRILIFPEYSLKMFDPERSIVHVKREALLNVILAGEKTRKNYFERAIDELTTNRVFTEIHDAEVVSYFINLRHLLRVNIRHDPDTAFTDISAYLLEELESAY